MAADDFILVNNCNDAQSRLRGQIKAPMRMTMLREWEKLYLAIKIFYYTMFGFCYAEEQIENATIVRNLPRLLLGSR